MRVGTKVTVRPFLRWAGGKCKFVHEIVSRLPALAPGRTYFEPFLGAGAVFLAYAPNKAILSDLNPDLINVFQGVRDDVSKLVVTLQSIHYRDSEESYYRVRDRFNNGGVPCLQAARFIYLNQTSFNGIYRVNAIGRYNVPYGFKSHPNIPTKRELDAASRLLKNAEILLSDYRISTASAGEGDVVYLDPPYPPLNGTSYFTHYTKERFSEDDQVSVAQTAEALRARGCFVMVTNADTALIRKLYSGWHISEIMRPRWITSSRHKHRVIELVITSCYAKEQSC